VRRPKVFSKNQDLPDSLDPFGLDFWFAFSPRRERSRRASRGNVFGGIFFHSPSVNFGFRRENQIYRKKWWKRGRATQKTQFFETKGSRATHLRCFWEWVGAAAPNYATWGGGGPRAIIRPQKMSIFHVKRRGPKMDPCLSSMWEGRFFVFFVSKSHDTNSTEGK
jgi:hypothetical protein